MERSDPPPSGPTCGECAHARVFGTELGQRLCKRYPPEVFPVQTAQGIAAMTLPRQVKTTDDACGEFKPAIG